MPARPASWPAGVAAPADALASGMTTAAVAAVIAAPVSSPLLIRFISCCSSLVAPALVGGRLCGAVLAKGRPARVNGLRSPGELLARFPCHWSRLPPGRCCWLISAAPSTMQALRDEAADRLGKLY